MLSFLGYGYVKRGELAGHDAAATLQRVGADDESAGPGRPALAIDPRAVASLQAESPDVFWYGYALALAEAQVPERARPLFGVDRGNGQLLFARLRDYIISHGLVDRSGLVHADDLLADFLGQREFGQLALTRLLLEALKLPTLTAEQIAAFNAGDKELLARIAKGFVGTTGEPDAGSAESDEE